MVKKFYEYKSHGLGYELGYELINKNIYRSSICDLSEYDQIQKTKISDFSDRDIKEITSLGFDVAFSKFDEFDAKNIISLFEKNEIVPKFIITKIEDEYFFVNKIDLKDESDNRYTEKYDREYYKCDQLDGLIKCIKDVSEN